MQIKDPNTYFQIFLLPNTGRQLDYYRHEKFPSYQIRVDTQINASMRFLSNINQRHPKFCTHGQCFDQFQRAETPFARRHRVTIAEGFSPGRGGL